MRVEKDRVGGPREGEACGRSEPCEVEVAVAMATAGKGTAETMCSLGGNLRLELLVSAGQRFVACREQRERTRRGGRRWSAINQGKHATQLKAGVRAKTRPRWHTGTAGLVVDCWLAGWLAD